MVTSDIEEAAEIILEEGARQDASYCEVRTEESSNETIVVEGRLLKSSFTCLCRGVGIRVIADGGWGFSSTTNLDRSSLEDAVKSATSIGRSAGNLRKKPVRLAEAKRVRDRVSTKVRRSFSNVCFDEKVNTLLECNKRLKASDEVVKTTAALVQMESRRYIATSDGAAVDLRHSVAFGSLSAFGLSSGVSEAATIEYGGSGGYEVAEPNHLLDLSESVGRRCTQLLKAKGCPTIGRAQIVMDPSFLALLVHEIIGHPSEADRVLGWENAWGGSAWWAGLLGQKVGSDLLSAVDDGSIEGSLGYTPYDDEAVKCVRNYLIKDGFLVGHIQSRETADAFGAEAGGGMRAFSFGSIPLIRMSNTFILGGDWKSEEIIEETKDGLFVRHYASPSIDDRRYRWAVTPQETYVIKDGELGELYRGGVVMGIAPEFLRSIDAVGSNLNILPLIGCGKGDPEQLICVNNGGPTLRGVANVIGRGE